MPPHASTFAPHVPRPSRLSQLGESFAGLFRRTYEDEPGSGEAAEALAPKAEAPALLAAALEALPDALLLVAGSGARGDGRVVSANAAARALLRIRSSNEPVASVLRRPELLDAVEAALAGHAEHNLAYEPGGSPARHWQVWIKPLGAAAGRRYAMLVLRDDTLARQGERLRVDFLANASHELRTPLSSLSGFIETLRGHAREDSGARERFLEIMAAQAARMGRLLDDLLSLSRIELNEHVPPTGQCDLPQVAAEVAAGLAPVAAARRVRVEVSAADDDGGAPAVVAGDRDQLAQVLQNLVANAVKFSPQDGTVVVEISRPGAFAPLTDSRFEPDTPRIALLSPERAHEGLYLRVTVHDEGEGMAREHLPRLTERFYRVPGQKSGDGSGTGLGLAIVKHVVSRHRGGLVVESAPGRGTAFSVYLPIPRDATAVTKASWKGDMASAPPTPAG